MPPARQPVVRDLALDPDLREVGRARSFLEEIAEEAGFPQERIFEIKVACSEAIANAIEHVRADGGVKVTTFLYTDRLEVQIEGPGAFQPPSKATEQVTRGLGLPLMAFLSDHMALYSGPRGGTLVSLTFHRSEMKQEEDEDSLPPSIRELVEENELTSAIVNTAPVGMYVLGADLRYRWANPMYQSFLEEPYCYRDLTGLHLAETRPDLAKAEALESLQSVSETGEPLMEQDYEFLGNSRGPMWWRRTAVPLRRESKEPPYDLLVMITDITEPKRAEEALRESEEGLRMVLENSLDGINMLNLATRRYEILSPAQVEMTGFAVEDLQGMTAEEAYDRVHPDDREISIVQQERVVAGEDPGEPVEYRWKTKSGEYRWFSDRRKLVRDRQGRPLAIVGISRDITERKQAEAERDRLAAEAEELAQELQSMNEELQAQGEELRATNEQLVAMNAQHQLDLKLTEALADLSAASAIQLDQEVVIRSVLPEALAVLGANWARFLTPADDGWQVRYTAGEPPAGGKPDATGIDSGLVIKLEQGRGPVVVLEKDRGGPGPGGCVLIPVFEGPEMAGVLQLGYVRALNLRESHRQFARRLSYVISLAFQNARLYESQKDIAQELQLALLDIPREIGRVKFRHLYRSATLEAWIGGDFYDVFEVKDGRVAVLIGDVSGHGVSAARIATLSKDVIHAFAHQFRRPGVVLRKTNDLLLEKQVPGFVTLFLGMLDIDEGLLTYSSAGHPNSMLRLDNGEVKMLEANTAPLGVFAGYSWKDHEIQLERNELLLLYTDGVIEARRNGQFFGQSGLARTLKQWSDPSPDDLPKTIVNELLAFSDGVLTDDVALLALCLTEPVDRKGSKKKVWRQGRLLKGY